MGLVAVSLLIVISCGESPTTTESNKEPEITKASGWAIESIDPSFWTKRGDNSNATALRNFWIYASDPDGIEDIIYVSVTDPGGTNWTLRDNDTGKDHYDDEGEFFGGWRRYYDTDQPNAVILGQYTVLVRDSAGNEVTDTISVNSPGTNSGSDFIYSENYTGLTSGSIEMLKRATIIDVMKGQDDMTLQFQVDDSRVFNGFIWFYDDSTNYITWSGLIKNKVNEGVGFFKDGTTNTLKIQSSDLELGDFTFDNIKGIHLVLRDGIQFSPKENVYDHRSVSQYYTIP